jgi:hypothetical protein
MFFEGYMASEIAKMETKQAERRAAARWRFRHIKSRESKALTAIITSVLGLFVR